MGLFYGNDSRLGRRLLCHRGGRVKPKTGRNRSVGRGLGSRATLVALANSFLLFRLSSLVGVGMVFTTHEVSFTNNKTKEANYRTADKAG